MTQDMDMYNSSGLTLVGNRSLNSLLCVFVIVYDKIYDNLEECLQEQDLLVDTLVI